MVLTLNSKGIHQAQQTYTIRQTHMLTFSAAAFVPVGTVNALGSILAGSAGTLINVDLTHGASKP